MVQITAILFHEMLIYEVIFTASNSILDYKVGKHELSMTDTQNKTETTLTGTFL